MYLRSSCGGMGDSALGIEPRLWRSSMCALILASVSLSGWSRRTKMRSKRESMVTGRVMFSATVR